MQRYLNGGYNLQRTLLIVTHIWLKLFSYLLYKLVFEIIYFLLQIYYKYFYLLFLSNYLFLFRYFLQFLDI
ncbi:hypothetical protein CGC43_08565 [Francisella opportunistica]|uniref:Uncharacterized protein n=1 Tax=Francisella opportunistica TaxID=2016517 RepID=A0A345JTH1_9GAMM|nr:hypothetical protein CGC43_08565 [Francisella opportunistica]